MYSVRVFTSGCLLTKGWDLIKKKKPYVETRGSNDCLPYESANVRLIVLQLYFLNVKYC
ncbi:hypothetical protein SAMN05660816_03523 [Niastella yeongjuensis]|nr:hypothetical protein SAMN05660816_03523 [Niastella yeongjuensis]